MARCSLSAQAGDRKNDDDTLPWHTPHAVGCSRRPQRIAIARALLKRPRVLIFDEATSALDPVTAEHLDKTINTLKGAVTMLFIAHQLPKNLHIDGVVKIAPRPTVVTEEGWANDLE